MDGAKDTLLLAGPLRRKAVLYFIVPSLLLFGSEIQAAFKLSGLPFGK